MFRRIWNFFFGKKPATNNAKPGLTAAQRKELSSYTVNPTPVRRSTPVVSSLPNGGIRYGSRASATTERRYHESDTSDDTALNVLATAVILDSLNDNTSYTPQHSEGSNNWEGSGGSSGGGGASASWDSSPSPSYSSDSYSSSSSSSYSSSSSDSYSSSSSSYDSGSSYSSSDSGSSSSWSD